MKKSLFAVQMLIAAALGLGVISFGITKEVPVGSMEGTVMMTDLNRPLADREIDLRPIKEFSTTPAYAETDETRPMASVKTDQNGDYSVSGLPAGPYELTVYTKAHVHETVRVVVEEGKKAGANINLSARPDYFELYATDHTVLPTEKIECAVDGFGKGDEFKVRTFKIRPESLLQATSLSQLLSPLKQNLTNPSTDPRTLGDLVESTTEKVVTRDAEDIFHQNIGVHPKGEGVYWTECEFNGVKAGTWFVVSNLALVLKEAPGQAIVFACDLSTGKPVPGVDISMQSNGARKSLGKTDSQGLLSAKISPTDSDSMILMGTINDSVAVVSHFPQKPESAQSVMFWSTDRPVYRPGDTIQFRGIVRNQLRGAYSLKNESSALISVRDASSDLIEQFSVPVSSAGSFSGSFQTNREADPGYFEVAVKIGSEEEFFGVNISEYRKPEFEIKVDPDKAVYYRGEKAKMTVQCNYYFGAPVQNAKVSAIVRRSPNYDYSYLEGYEDWGYEDEFESEIYYGGEYVAEVEATTDSSGRAVIEFETSNVPDQTEDWNFVDATYTVEASVADDSGKYFDGSGSVKVIRSNVSTQVQPSKYVVQANKPVEVKVIARDSLTDEPLKNTVVRVEAGYSGALFKPFATGKYQTNSEGEVSVTVTPFHRGDLMVRAVAVDANGRSSESTGYVWITGQGEQEVESDNRDPLLVKLNQDIYRTGATCSATIQSEFKSGYALVTMEADRVLAQKVVRLEEGIADVSFPITTDYAPNATLSVCLVNDKEFFYRDKSVIVELNRKKLNVLISTDKAIYRPGESATYSIRSEDENGNPVPAEFSLGIVDESIYAIAPDRTNILKTFYPRRYTQVNTRYSFESIYLDGGDKAPKNIGVRKNFKDTAYWNPSIKTDASGRARIQCKLPDNLTTWRATAIGCNLETRVGQATHKIKVAKPLMVRLQASQFWVSQDEQSLVAMVTNDSGVNAKVNIELEAPASVGLEGQTRQNQTINSGDTASFTWQVKPSQSGAAKFVAKVWIGDRTTDGVELIVPVKPLGDTIHTSFAGSAKGDHSFTVEKVNAADPHSGRLKITLSPTIASSMVQSLDSLIDYPYGCVEQTMSRFLPALAVSNAIQSAGLPAPPRAAEIPAIAANSITRLKSMQHTSGGFGWWEYDEDNEGMTGYVLQGLKIAKNVGFTFPSGMLEKALEFGQKQSATDLKWNDEPYAKANQTDISWYQREKLQGRVRLALGVALHTGSVKVPNELRNLAYYRNNTIASAEAALLFSGIGDQAFANQLLDQLISEGIETAGTMGWKEEYGIEGTAKALHALLIVRPESPLIPKIIRHLMLSKKGNEWWNTRDTSAALLAITEYWKKSRELEATGTVRVLVNGKPYRELPISRDSIFKPDFNIEIPIGELNPGQNTIQIQSNGTVYYAADFRQVDTSSSMASKDTMGGVEISRAYYALEHTELVDGTAKLLQLAKTISGATSGDLVRVILTVETKSPKTTVMLEDPIPSNCRVNDRDDRIDFSDWSFWYSRMIIRDDRVVFFVTNLPPGTHMFSYVMRAENPGKAMALPSQFSNMYDPFNRSTTAAQEFTVSPK